MSKAEQSYEQRIDLIMKLNDRETAIKDSVYIDYILELKQQNEELLESLENIKVFGFKNPGLAYSCAKMADETLNKYKDN